MSPHKILQDPGCVSAAVAVLGDKWTPLLIRSLTGKKLHFCQLQNEMGGVNPRTLSARLSYLETIQVVQRVVDPKTTVRAEYILTEKGKDLIPILEKMAAWNNKHAATTQYA